MKAIFMYVLIIGVAYSATTIATDGVNKWELTLSPNSIDSTNTDVTLKLTHGTNVVAIGKESIVACVNTKASNFTLSADQTGLQTFLAKVTVQNTDTLIAASSQVFGTDSYYINTGEIWNKLASAALTSPVPTVMGVDSIFIIIYSALSPVHLSYLKLPNSSEVFYWR